MGLLLGGVTKKRKLYRGFVIQVTKEGSWVEANLYRADGRLEESLGHGTYGPGVFESFFRKGTAIIDAMKGD